MRNFVIGFVTGVVVGASATYIYTRWREEKEWKELEDPAEEDEIFCVPKKDKVTPPIVTEEEKIDYANLVNNLYTKKPTKGPVYPITEEEYHDTRNSYDKTMLTYYAGNGALVTEDDCPVIDLDYYMGINNLALFDEGVTDIYIRNENLGADFHIIWSDDSYEVELEYPDIDDE